MAQIKIGSRGQEKFVELDVGDLILMKRNRFPKRDPVLEVVREIWLPGMKAIMLL